MGIDDAMQSKRVVSPVKAYVPQKGSSASLENFPISNAREKVLEVCCTPFFYRRI